VRDWLPIRREQCAKRVSRKSRWSRSHPRGGSRPGVGSRQAAWHQRADNLHMARSA
jgi:hypothetical protein